MGDRMTSPQLHELLAALADDGAITLSSEGWPEVPNKGWAASYMSFGYGISACTLELVQSSISPVDVTRDDEKDLRIVARRAGFVPHIERDKITFRLYNAWED